MSNKTQDFTTIDTCLDKVTNRFELSVIVAKRAEEIENSNNAVIDSPHKSTVLAMEELSQGFINVDSMKEKIILGMQKNKRVSIDSDELSEQAESDAIELKEDLMDGYIENESELSLSEDEMSLLDDDEISLK
jgi:DNA-directed RNA polymerase subunit omega